MLCSHWMFGRVPSGRIGHSFACLAPVFVCCWFLFGSASIGFSQQPDPAATALSYRQQVLDDDPIAYWGFDETDGKSYPNLITSHPADAVIQGNVLQNLAGPRQDEFPLFDDTNACIGFKNPSVLRVANSGGRAFQFSQDEPLTIEAWVAPESGGGSGFAYIIGKGRTHNAGFSQSNHNYALRLDRKGGTASLSFLFRSAEPNGDWHRWTSNSGFSIGDGWHHVAISFQFGKGSSIRGYIDGEPVKGKWDMGGQTDAAPVVDEDEVWIGSSMGVAAGSTFHGQMDEVALYRKIIPPERIAARFQWVGGIADAPTQDVPADRVLVEIYERLPDKKTWKFRSPRFSESLTAPILAFVDIPKKYNERGVHVDRSSPFLVRAWTRVVLPEGDVRLLIRSRNASRLFVDGEQVAETQFHSISSSAHGKVVPLDRSLGDPIRAVPRGDTQQVAQLKGDGQRHELRFEMIVGGRNHRPEFGETSVSMSVNGAVFELVSHEGEYPLTDEGWRRFAADQREWLIATNYTRRRTVGAAEDQYWQRRHELARDSLPSHATIAHSPAESGELIESYLQPSWKTAGASPSRPLTDDEFIRRVTLDLTGVVPTRQQLERFRNDQSADRRLRLVDRLLESPRWADHWVSYWQDVLAENPNIVNPTLNNTGPFRWWIHESFLENKPIDRFATELIRMEGSRLYGGPGGFALATQNDAPMAAKAHVIGQAFLGLEMKCARCHDAPFHDFAQEDLFSLAAMLKQSPQKVPATSTIPGGDAAASSLIVEVNLKPGQEISPKWTFPEFAAADFPQDWVRQPNDTREQLAWLVTQPTNRRFAEVIVNRLWQRYLGYGIVEPVDDWDSGEPSHPELLAFLANQFIASGYDLKHVARLIVSSPAYQRAPVGRDALPNNNGPWHFAAPIQRRLSAEQLVDSLFVIADMPFDAGVVCIDIDGARSPNNSLNLGEADRAWHFSSLSNERDRPSLALPFAQPFVTMLETFGWRSSRQNPVTDRNTETTVLQPAALNNSILVQRVARLSERNGLTQLMIAAEDVDELISGLFDRILARSPSPDERVWFRELLVAGFEDRVVAGAQPVSRKALRRGLVSWSNHLHTEANVIKNELERAVREGDPPTNRLTPDWRQRAEDAVWVLLNSPEFMHMP